LDKFSQFCMTDSDKIIQKLPYGKNFLFVDSIMEVVDEKIAGMYTFRSGNPLFSGHFNDKLIIPGVIVMECMGQIGMVAHIVHFRMKTTPYQEFYPIVVNIESEFFKKIEPDKKMIILGKKKYFINNLLRSDVTITDEENTCYARLNALIKVIDKNEL